jgi:hypothetical protein
MKHIVIKSACVLMFAAAALIGSGQVNAAPSDSGNKAVAAKGKKKAGASGQIRFLPGSAETTKERGSRLKRECKGRVNAGACAGYTG